MNQPRGFDHIGIRAAALAVILVLGACAEEVDPTGVPTASFSIQQDCPDPLYGDCELINSQVVEGWIEDLQAQVGSEADPECLEALNALENAALGSVYFTDEMGHYTGGRGTIGPGYIILNEDHFDGTLSDHNRDMILHEALHNAGYEHDDFGGESPDQTEFAAQCMGRSPASWPTV